MGQQKTQTKSDTGQQSSSTARASTVYAQASGMGLLELHSTIGNRAVSQLLGRPRAQAKLRVGPAGDSFEQEADRVADAMVGGGERANSGYSSAPAGLMQRKCAKCEEEEEEELHRKPVAGSSAESVSHSGLSRTDLPQGGAPLGNSLRAFFEPRFSRDFSGVRIHTGGRAAGAANRVRARAFTLGEDIVFGAGEFQPDTTAGRHLLAHELTHVVQQSRPGGSAPAVQRELVEPDGGGTATADSAAPVADTTSEAASPETAADMDSGSPDQKQASAGTSLIVDDSVQDAAPGQMHKTEFLDALRASVCPAADAAMASTGQTTEDCPYIEHWFSYYATQDASHVEEALHKWAPESASATSASEYIDIVTAHVQVSIASWVTTGEMPVLPEGATADLPGAAASPGVMAKSRSGGFRTPRSPRAIRARLGRGTPLEGNVRSRMESAFGLGFSGVRLHTGAPAARLSGSLNARAFTVGEHVAFGAGEYQPGTPAGDALIAHELAHVVQQGNGAANLQTKGETPNDALEQDADRAAVGAVVSLWSKSAGGMQGIRKNILPSLKTGLRLSRCKSNSSSSSGPAPACPAETISMSNPRCGATYGAVGTYCYGPGAANWWFKEEVSNGPGITCRVPGTITQERTPKQLADSNGCISDDISNGNGPPSAKAPCVDTTLQTVFAGPTQATVEQCRYAHTQVITITENTPATTPRSGRVTTEANQGGTSTFCNW